MPVYMRKRQDSLSLSQFSEANPDIDQDFVLDPDKHRDLLPQPYRFIDKVLDGLLERTYQEIFSREEERENEQSRYKPPLVPTDLCRVVPGVQSVRCLRVSSDNEDEQQAGRFVFCACEGQILALDAVSMATQSSFEAPGLDVSHIETAQIKPGLHLLATLDDLGFARLFLWDTGAFYLARLMNEEEGEKKINCLAVHISADGEYVALALQNPSTQVVTLEFYRIPRDAWAKEIEQQAGKPTAGATTGATVDPATGKSGPIPEEADGSNERTDNLTGVNNAGSEEAARVPQIKLSAPTPVLRVKQPPLVTSTAGVTAPNLKAVDATGEVVGAGYAHLLTQSHLQLREASFQSAHRSAMRYLAEEKPDEGGVLLPSVLFLKPGRILGTDQTSDKDLFVSAAVSWSGDYKVLIYSLLKVGKDLEFRPDYVWTCGSPVTCLAASPCTGLVAIGLESGNLIVHDARLGLTRHVIGVDPAQPIRQVFFLNPSAAGEPGDYQQHQQVYKSVQPVRAVILTADLAPYITDLGPGVVPVARRLPTSVRHAYEAPELVDYPRFHPTLLARTSRSGAIVLQDVRHREILQFGLPPPYQLPCPWQRGGWAMAGGGRSLFVRGRDSETGDEKLFFYSLRMLIPMSSYWKLRAPETPCYAHCKVEQRADAYLQHRNATHTERQKSLADMWSNLFTTLKEVESAKAAFVSSETPRSVRLRYYP